MSPIAIGIFIILTFSLPKFDGAGDNRNGEISETDLKNIMVSLSSEKKMDFICLAVFIRWNWILLTTYCHKTFSPFKDKMFMRYGLNAREDPIPEYMNIVQMKQVDILSKFSIMFLDYSNPIPLYLKLGYVDSHLMEDRWFDGKMTGWTKEEETPEIVNVKLKFDPNIQLDKEMSTYNILDFPYGSVITMGGEIIALRGNEVLFDQITFADKLIVEEMLELQEKADREGTPQIDFYKDGRIRKIDFYTIMVSFWKSQGALNPLELICLGILIQSNLIILTAFCGRKLKPPGDIVIKSEGYAVHNSLLDNIEIASLEKVHPNSMFSIVYLKSPIPLSLPLELDCVDLPPGYNQLFEGTLVGWNEQKKRPEPLDAKIIVTSDGVSLEKAPGTCLQSIIREGSIIVRDGKIIALANRPGRRTSPFSEISPVDKLRIEEILNIQNNVGETSRAGQIESGETSGINFNNFMASFWEKQEALKKLQLIGLGVFIRFNWILVTRTCAEQLKLSNNIVIRSGDEDVQRSLSQNTGIQKIEKLHADSNFRIVYLRCHVALQSSPQFEFFFVASKSSHVYNGTLVGVNEQNASPRTAIGKITIRDQLWLSEKMEKYPRSIFPDGTAVLSGTKIIAFAGNIRVDSQGINFFKIGLDDELRIETDLEIADESYREENVNVSEEDCKNVIAVFRRTNADGNEEIVCLGAFIIGKWVLVTKKCLDMLNQYSVTTTTIGSDFLRLNIVGKQIIGVRSNFVILISDSDTQVTSPVKLFYQNTNEFGTVDEKLFGWNTQGMMTDNVVYSKCKINSKNSVRFPENKKLIFPSGSVIVWRKDKITALSFVKDGKNRFHTIQFPDYVFIQALAREVKPLKMVELNKQEDEYRRTSSKRSHPED